MHEHAKVFISHASEDRQRFVEPFAKRLRKKGVDAWVYFWEMLPGDRLVAKIFDEGLKLSDVVIVVLSQFSAEKPWVQEERDYAIVRRIEGTVKLTPIRLDRWNVPEAMKTTLWIDIPDLGHYEAEFDHVLNSIFGQYDKPPLGDPPTYIRHKLPTMEGLAPMYGLVLEAACLGEIETGLPSVGTNVFVPALEGQGMTERQIIDTQQILDAKGLVKLHWAGPPHQPQTMEVTFRSFEIYAQTRIAGYESLVAEVGRHLVREEEMDNKALADVLGQPIRIVTHVLSDLAGRGYIEIQEAFGAGYQHVDVGWVSPELRQWLESL